MINAYSITQINEYIAAMFSNDYLLHAPIWVQGEVSQCAEHTASGTIYFTLKDEKSVLSCAMFRWDRQSGLRFKLETGQKVLVCGEVSVYTRTGRYQMRAKTIRLDGIGDLYEEYLRIRRSLEELGMFSPVYKQPIPAYVSTIGVVTSPSGSVVWDVIHVAKQRHPGIRILVYPAKVEGEGAAASLVRGMEAMQNAGVDAIIIGRGGGSLEELWPFNEEAVAHAIFNSAVPVISAVGHETNMMISDLAADLHENAPSTAAVKAVPDMAAVKDEIEAMRETFRTLMNQHLQRCRSDLSRKALQLKLYSPKSKITQQKVRAKTAREALQHNMERLISQKKAALSVYEERLRGLSPYAKLEQGYAFVTDEKGERIAKAAQAMNGQVLTLRFADGAVTVKVVENT